MAIINDFVYIDALIAAGIMGVSGGIIGSLFIRINNQVNIMRKKIVTTKPKKVLEACILVIVSVSVFYASAYFREENAVCKIMNDPDDALIKVKF